MGATDAVAEVNAIAVGVKVWLPDGGEEAYISGEVTSIEGDKVTVQIPGAGDKVVPAADCSLCEKATQEDMVKLNYLHEPGVLNNLQSRYGLDEIYTYTGSILIAVRPRPEPATTASITPTQRNPRVESTIPKNRPTRLDPNRAPFPPLPSAGEPVPAPAPPLRPPHDGPVPGHAAGRAEPARLRHRGGCVSHDGEGVALAVHPGVRRIRRG